MQLTLAQGYSISTMLAVAVVAILLTGVFYFRAFGTLPTRRWRLLLALRVTAILLVVLLLFRPVLSYQNVSTEKPTLILLLDRSASMSIADDTTGVSRFDRARDKLIRWCEKLKNDFRLLPIAFAERTELLADPGQLSILTPTGQATSLSRALVTASKQVSPAELSAIILLSDGIQTAAGNPLEVADRLGLVVHSVGVGASLRNNRDYRDVQLTGIDCPERMILNNVARVTGSIDAVGLEGHVIKVFCDEDGQEIGQAELTLDNVEGSQQVVFEFRPSTKGRHSYRVRVPTLGDEKIVQNNRREATATVVEPGMRVLYIEGTLRAEYGALVNRFLAKDPDLEFCALVQTRPNVFLKRSNMTDLQLKAIPTDQATIDQFDVFIFGDLDSSYLREEQQKMFVQRIRDGAGLLMLGGYHSLGPGGYAETPLGEVLPVSLGGRQIGQITDPFLPVLTPEGVRHPIFANIADFFPTQQGSAKIDGLPPLDGCTRVDRPRPGATVLAICPVADAMPVLAVQPVGQGRTAVFAGDTTRAWQQGPRALGQESPFLRFWGQMVRWLAGRGASVQHEAGIVAGTDKANYEPGEPINISAIVRDKDGQGANNAKVVAQVRDHVGRSEQVKLTSVAGPSGHYGGAFEPQLTGAFELVVEARIGEMSLASKKIQVEVGRPNLEFERLDFDEKLLEQIAAKTGGRYVPLLSADLLIDQLDRQQRKKTESIERPLFWPPGFWMLFVAVLTTEWILRRRYQLR